MKRKLWNSKLSRGKRYRPQMSCNNAHSRIAGKLSQQETRKLVQTQYLQIFPIRMNLGKINSMSMEMRMEMSLNLILMKKLQQTAMKVMMLKPNNLMG